ncbi:MAG: hypothetical protein ACK5LT_11950 [Lachnospirales bacterium]
MNMKKTISMTMVVILLMNTEIFASEYQDMKVTSTVQNINYKGEELKVIILLDTAEKTETLITGEGEQYLVVRNNIGNTSITYDLSENPINNFLKLRSRNIKNISDNFSFNDFNNPSNNYVIINNKKVESIDISLREQEETNKLNAKRRVSKKQDTFSNYEYTKYYGEQDTWQLRRPKKSLLSYYCLNKVETPKNSSEIKRFYKAVEDIDSLEKKLYCIQVQQV